MWGRSRTIGDSRNSAPAAASVGRCTRVGKCKRSQSPSRVARSREGDPTSSRRVRATAAQEGERSVGVAAMEHSRKLDRVVHCYRAELCVRYRSGIRTQAEDRCVLLREHLRECRAGGEVLMENLFQLGMRDTDPSAPDGRRTSNGGVLKGTSKRATTDHSSRAHDNKVLLTSRPNA